MNLSAHEVSASPSRRPNPGVVVLHPANLVDLASLRDPSCRLGTINQIEQACMEAGYFLVTSHGVPQSLMEDALVAAADFFDLPEEQKMLFSSSDVNKPVRYGTGFNNQTKDGTDHDISFRRDFLKHYSHPLHQWISSWPTNPPHYRNKMGEYAAAMQALAAEILKAIFESLGLNSDFYKEEIAQGSQVMFLNSYPQNPNTKLGIPPHTDFGLLTILSQNCKGLQVLDREGNWVPVPAIDGVLVVQVGDHLEVLSNGKYKAVMHRAFGHDSHKARISIASLHSLALDKKVGPARELVDGLHPVAYTESSFQDFLDYLSAYDIGKGKRFIETLKI